MNVIMTIRLEYDKERDGGLPDFKKKIDGFKNHITVMQIKGLLPMGNVEYKLGRKAKPLQLPEARGLSLVPLRNGEWFVAEM